MDVEVNYLAVFLAAVSSMVVGSVWYARPVFGALWIKLAKIDEKKMGNGIAKELSLVFVLSLVTAYILAHVSFLSNAYFDNSFFSNTLSTAFWLWLGLVVTRITTHNIFEQKPAKLTLLSIGNEFVTIMLMGVIIGWLHP